MSKPIAVVISDIHFNINTLELATQALEHAITTAEQLNIPLIVAGDLHDTKAIVRAEVANVLCKTFKHTTTPCYIISGNHDRISEKHEEHGLNYLRPYADIVDTSTGININGINLELLPYFHDLDYLQTYLKVIPKGTITIMHQGFQGAWMGDYIQDKTSLPLSAVEHLKVITGHYHKHQTLGTVTYIGSPYTITFGEANDGDKGYLVLHSDGSYDRKILKLRKHVIIEGIGDEEGFLLEWAKIEELQPEDLVWVKIKGPKSCLDKINKVEFGKAVLKRDNFKLDLIPIDAPDLHIQHEKMTDDKIFDSIIDNLNDSLDYKEYLKRTYHEVTNN